MLNSILKALGFKPLSANDAPLVLAKPLPEGEIGPITQVRSVGTAKRASQSFVGPTIEQAMIAAVEEANKAGIATSDPRIRHWMENARAHTKVARRQAQATGKPAYVEIGTRRLKVEYRP